MICKTSKTGNLKSVFNTPDDNLHYFRILKRGIGISFGKIEFAEPIYQPANQTIAWKISEEGTCTPFSGLGENQKLMVGKWVKEGSELFRSQLGTITNAPPNFCDQLLEIPSTDALILFKGQDGEKVILTEWGFWPDEMHRTEGLITSIFPPPEHTILLKLANPANKPVPGETLQLNSHLVNRNGISDEQGFVRLGALPRDTPFTILSPNNSFKKTDFITDNRPEYTIVVPTKIQVTVQVRNQHFVPIESFRFAYISPEGNKEFLQTNKQGIVQFQVWQETGEYVLTDSMEKVIHRNFLPGENFKIDLTIEVSEPIPDAPPPIPEAPPLNLKFLNWYGSPIRNHPIVITNRSQDFYKKTTTDDSGMITLENIPENQEYSISTNRNRRDWNFNFIHDKNHKNHTFKLALIWPWWWWLLLCLLLFLLFFCYRGCLCDLIPKEEVVVENSPLPPENAIPCDQTSKSGGEGVTENNHIISAKNGVVVIAYNMLNIRDLMEVFYEDKLIYSTGFVNGIDTLKLNYTPNQDNFITVRIKGLKDTDWSYTVLCN